jgi:hypothetical protein
VGFYFILAVDSCVETSIVSGIIVNGNSYSQKDSMSIDGLK